MQKIILDTNVIISSLITPSGIPAKIIDNIVIEGMALICLSDEILEEYLDVLNRDKFKKYRNFQNKSEIIIGYLGEIGKKYIPKRTIDKLSDQSDNKFLELAIESKADYIVTGNTNDFNISLIERTRIVTPTEYWEKHKPY